MLYKSSIGQDSHRIEENTGKPFILGGLHFDDVDFSLSGNSDADVVLHAITNAISGITGRNILGKVADHLCLNQGIKDSSIYLKEAMKDLGNHKIEHVSISIEAKRPKISPKIPAMKESIARLLKIEENQIGITATSGENLSDFGKGLGIQTFVILSFSCPL